MPDDRERVELAMLAAPLSEQIDVGESLVWWRDQVTSVADQVRTTWGFFNNDFSGYSVATCNRFKSLIGEPVKEPPAIPGGLFG